MDRFLLWGTYCEDVLERRKPFRELHLSRLSTLKEKGILITLGPTKCNRYVFGVFQAETLDLVKTLVEEDIYWEKGIWTTYKIYPWIQAF